MLVINLKFSIKGFAPFLETKEFREMNVGVALDEGQASSNDEYSVYYGERLSWCKLYIIIYGFNFLRKLNYFFIIKRASFNMCWKRR
jgi:hypothetical protein